MRLDYERDHVLAGIKTFEKYGVSNTIDSLAGGDILKWEAVCQLEYELVFQKLRMNADQELFKRKLRTVIENKNKQKQK